MSSPFLPVVKKEGGWGGTSGISSRVDDFIVKHPTWMVYIRKDQRFPHAECYLSDSKSPDPTCETCWGLGYKVQLEKHMVRRAIASQAMDSPLLSHGYTGEYPGFIYSSRRYYQQQTDVYIDVEWDVDIPLIEKYGRPTRIVNAWVVDESVMQKESGSTFMACKIQQSDFNLKFLERLLLNTHIDWVVP